MNNTLSTKINFRILTIASLVLMMLVMLWASKDFGITGDEVTQNTYGEKVFNYFATFGKDKSCMSYKDLANYGGLYDLVMVSINKVVHFDPYNTRHFINAFVGFLLIVVASSWAKFYKGWAAAFLTAWFLFLTPRFFGESMNNPKDVPFALGMTLGAYYICRLVNDFPKLTWKHSIALILSIAFAIGMRVGGLLLIPYFVFAVVLKYFFEWRKQYKLSSPEIRTLLIRCAIVCLLGYIGGLLFWPYALEAPFSNPLKSLDVMAKFTTGVRMLFNDSVIMSTNVPWYYIPKWLWITTPLIMLAGMIASPVLFFKKQYKISDLAFLFFAALFPVFYVIYKKSTLYDGWRHLFFVYPVLVIMSALTFIALINYLKNEYARYAVAAAIFIGLLLPAKWCIANHPNEIVYFNELIGGIDGAYGYYETDYYMNSVKQAAYKLAQMENLYTIKDSPVVATNAIEPMLHYLKTINPRIKCEYIRYYQRYDKPWDYAIIYTRFIDKNLLQNNYFPPAGTIATIKADHSPLCAIVKKTQASEDACKAYQYVNAKDYNNAVVYYQKALTQDPNNETGYSNLAVALANTGRIDAAIDVLNRVLKFTPSSIETYDLLSKLYKAKGDNVHAQEAANTAQSIYTQQQGEGGE